MKLYACERCVNATSKRDIFTTSTLPLFCVTLYAAFDGCTAAIGSEIHIAVRQSEKATESKLLLILPQIPTSGFTLRTERSVQVYRMSRLNFYMQFHGEKQRSC